MRARQDRPILLVAGFAATMLLLVLTGDWIPLFFRSILYAGCMMSIFGILMLRNILRTAQAIVYWRLYLLGLAIYFGIFIAVILAHEFFGSTDTRWLGMEPGTAIMIFGTSLFPFWFIALWVVGFRRAIVPRERENHLNELKSEDEGREAERNG